MLFGFRSLHCVVFVLQDLLLDLLRGLLCDFYLVLVLILYFGQLVNQVLGVLRSQVVVLSQVLGGAAELENIGIERRHFRSNVVEQVSLDQVRSVNFKRNFFKEVVHVQIVLSNHIN